MREARQAQAPLQSPLLGGLDLGSQEPIGQDAWAPLADYPDTGEAQSG
jgi:hypothetical protein